MEEERRKLTSDDFYEAHVQAWRFLCPPRLKREGRLTDTQLRGLLRKQEVSMPTRRVEMNVKDLEVKDRALPVEVALKTNAGKETVPLENMDAFEAWFDDKRHRLLGHITDESMTMISAELIEEPVKKAKPPTKKVLEKGEEIKKERKAQLATDKREEKRAEKFRKRVAADAAKGAKTTDVTDISMSEMTGDDLRKGGKKGKAAAAPAKGKKAPAKEVKAAKAPKPKAPGGKIVQHSVKVTSSSFKGTKEFPSMRRAAEGLGLKADLGKSKIQKFRKELKAAGKGSLTNSKGVKFDFVAVAK